MDEQFLRALLNSDRIGEEFQAIAYKKLNMPSSELSDAEAAKLISALLIGLNELRTGSDLD